jgi:signal transduction histidine kinase
MSFWFRMLLAVRSALARAWAAVEGRPAGSALRASEMRSRRLFEAAQDGILVEIGQSLAVTESNLQALLTLPGSEAMASRLREGLEGVARVQEQVRDLSLNLRPARLDDLGLKATLRWCANRQAGLVGLRIEVRVDPVEHRLDPVIQSECFRTAQEALNNVVRHAQARSVTVELTRNDEQLHLSVRDGKLRLKLGP